MTLTDTTIANIEARYEDRHPKVTACMINIWAEEDGFGIGTMEVYKDKRDECYDINIDINSQEIFIV